MNPHEQFCHNKDCRAYAREGEGHIVIHSQKERRYQCKRCRRTFSQTTGTALYRLHKPKELVFTVITLLAHGCPLQAIVAAFGLDERTVARWEREAGMQCRRVHEHIVEAGRVELGQVQADELRVRVVGGVMWLAGSLAVESRLWLGGVVSMRQDRDLIRALLSRVRACGSVRAVLLCTDGLASYPKAAIHLFREPLRTGRVGRPRLILPEGVMIAQLIKRYARCRVIGVVRRVVTGVGEAVAARLRATQGGSETAVINTAYIRAATSHLPLPACRAGTSLARAGEAEGDACGGDVAGGHLLQLLLDAQKYAAGAREKRPARWEVGAEHSCPGGGTDGSSLVDRRVVELLCATR